MPGTEASRRALLGLSAPLVFASSVSMLSSVVDTVVIGQHSTTGLAAVSAGSAIVDVVHHMLIAGLLGFRVLANRAAGAGELQAGDRYLSVTFGAGVLAAAALGAVLALVGRPLLSVLTGMSEVTAAGYGYLLARAAALPLLVALAVLTAVAAATRDTKLSLHTTLVVVGVNLVLDYVLVFGAGPLPALGATGDGVATAVAAAAGLGYAVHRRRSDVTRVRRAVRERHLFDADALRAVGRLSWPAIVSAAADYLAAVVLIAVPALLGAAALGSARVGFGLQSLTFAVLAAIGAATMITFGRLLGAGRHADWAMTRRNALQVSLGVALLIGGPFLLFPSAVAGVFSADPEVVAMAAPPVLVVGCAVPLIAVCTTYVAQLRALGRTRVEMLINITSVWLVQIPCAVIGFAAAELVGLFLSVPAYWASRLAMTWLAVRRAESTLRQPEPAAGG